MPPALVAAMPPNLDLPDGYTVEWTAIDTSGADVSGVIVENVSLFGTNLGSGTSQSDLPLEPFMLVPGLGA